MVAAGVRGVPPPSRERAMTTTAYVAGSMEQTGPGSKRATAAAGTFAVRTLRAFYVLCHILRPTGP
jgi:hypothetical protein